MGGGERSSGTRALLARAGILFEVRRVMVLL